MISVDTTIAKTRQNKTRNYLLPKDEMTIVQTWIFDRFMWLGAIRCLSEAGQR